MVILKEGAFHWPDNNGKMKSDCNYKLEFFEKILDLVRDFLFQFDLIKKVWLPGVII